MRLTDRLLELVFPRCCAACAAACPGDAFCPDCRADLVPCGGDLSVFDYLGPIGDAIRAAKYDGRSEAMPAVAAETARTLPRWLRDDPPDLVVAVPLHPRRRAQRPLDAPGLLAHAVARALGARIDRRAVTRTRDTPPQAGLSASARVANVQGAFAAKPRVAGLDVLVVDDVVTTGATLGAVGEALRKAGAARVRGFAAAGVAPGRHLLPLGDEAALSGGAVTKLGEQDRGEAARRQKERELR